MSAEEIVRAEMAAWGRNDVDEVMSHFAEDAHFDIGPAYGKKTRWPVMGAYEVHDNKITAWRDYFYPPSES